MGAGLGMCVWAGCPVGDWPWMEVPEHRSTSGCALLGSLACLGFQWTARRFGSLVELGPAGWRRWQARRACVAIAGQAGRAAWLVLRLHAMPAARMRPQASHGCPRRRASSVSGCVGLVGDWDCAAQLCRACGIASVGRPGGERPVGQCRTGLWLGLLATGTARRNCVGRAVSRWSVAPVGRGPSVNVGQAFPSRHRSPWSGPTRKWRTCCRHPPTARGGLECQAPWYTLDEECQSRPCPG